LGVIVKQATYSTIFSYVGALLGFLNVTILMNRWFTTEELGLREIILNIAVIFAQLASLGTTNSLVKFFPFFNRTSNKDNGLLTIGAFISLVGFLVFAIILFIFKGVLIEKFNTKSVLFEEYFWTLFPLALLLLYNQLLENYIKARSRTALTTFLKEIFHRLIVVALLILFYYKTIDYYEFIIYFILSYSVTIFIYIAHLYYNKELYLKVDFKYFPARFRKIYFNYSLYSILSGFSNLLIAKIDIIMIGFVLGLTSTAIYANAVYLSVLIFIPALAMTKIASPIIAKEFKFKRIKEIEILYKKSSTTQFLVGGIIFILMWSSIDNFYEIQREEYRQGKFVLFLLGSSRVISMLFGLAGPIIHISKYYRFDTVTSISLAVLTVITNYIAIPLYGIEGAAFATMTSLSLFYFIRYLFVKQKIGIQPFTRDTAVVAIILICAFLLGKFLPKISNIYFDTIYRSVIVSLFAVFFTIYMKVSEEINRLFRKSIKKAGF
jgi:O-antigen/teichoic acid export membrane protein